MASRGPLFTLLAVGVLGAALFVVNATTARPEPAAPAAAAAPAATAAPPATTTGPPATSAAPVVAQAVYAGRSPGREITVAIAVKDGRAVAYVCDGKAVEAWLDGTLSGDTLRLTGRNGASLTGKATPDTVTGEVSAGGKSWTFSARVAGKPAGLYEGRADVQGVANRIGWIVLPDGTQVGIRSTTAGGVEPAPPLNPAAPGSVVVDGTTVQVTALDGSQPVTGS
jgi:hypothetical protein